jgi:hypothetical protein
MSNPTSSFGWQMPTASDLVTDLPADFETFGQAVDTTLADLKGGTTGQVLSKASNTDMDFTWVAQDDSNAIQNAIVDAKGDLIAASAADTPARLAVGNNGETLVADSSTSTGLRWQAPIQQNPVINSAFQVWQRGTSIAMTTTAYVSDRWKGYRSAGGATTSRQVTGDTTNLPNIQYCARVQRDSGNTSANSVAMAQSFETINSIPFAGKTVTFSFYARAGANFSPSAGLQVLLATGTGTDQDVISGFTGNTYIVNQMQALTTTWARYSYTATVGTSATQLATYFTYAPTGTAGAADYYEVTGVQVEVGSVATPFHTYAATIQGELAACQRYYYRQTADQSYSHFSVPGTADGTNNLHASIAVPVSMRINPTSVDFSTLCVLIGGSVAGFSSLAISTNQSTRFLPCVQVSTTGLTANAAYAIAANNSFNAYLGLSAEL